MDKQFLEFWGNLLLSAAKGQRQLDEFSRWMSKGMSGFRGLNDMFRQFYGLGREGSGHSADWHTARDSFDKAYRAYLETLGVVPASEYLALKKQLEALQKKAQDQETALRKLRLELSECKMAQGDVVRGFQELMEVQSKQFQDLTNSFSRFFADRRTNKVDLKKP